jgi:hypothetical protein
MGFNTFALLVIAIQAFAVNGLKPVPIGQVLPVGTLFPQSLRVKPDGEDHDGRNATYSPARERRDTPLEGRTLHIFGNDDDDDDVSFEEHPDESSGDDGNYDEFSDYVPYDETNRMTLVRKGLMKRAPAFRGTMHMDCKKAREACQNACWYQNCVMGAQGSAQQVIYREGGGVVNRDDDNRVQSGVTISRGTPCNAWPFAQRFWDMYDGHVRDGASQRA